MQSGLHQDLIAHLGQAVGIPGLAFDDDGYVCLSFDDVVLDIEHQAGVLLVTSEVGRLPEPENAQFLGGLLELNHARLLQEDGAIGIDRAGGRIVFIDRAPLRGMTHELFEARLKEIIEAVETWRKWLQELNLGRHAEKAPDWMAGETILRV